jgi:hypothetical protein
MRIVRSFLDRPIRTKIGLGILFLVLGISIFNVLFFPAQQKKAILEGIRSKGESIATMLAYELGSFQHLEDRQFIREVVKKAFQDEELVLVRISRALKEQRPVCWR